MISDLLRLQLELRRLWLDVADKLGAEKLCFNEADLVLAGLLFASVDATALVCLDPRLHERLNVVCGRSDLARKHGIRLALDRCPADQASVLLVPIQQIQSHIVVESLSHPDRVVAVYGFNAGWSPAAWAPADWPSTISLRPASHLSPALWRSNIQVAMAASQTDRIEMALGRIVSVLNDRDLDICTLLERIQKLEENLRGRTTSLVVKPATPSENPDERVVKLEREIEELQRTIALMHYSLAFASSELSKTLED